jgi:ornithine cyclodeaminase/alanine dehydrogenase-like protein (mu-crystallin family)
LVAALTHVYPQSSSAAARSARSRAPVQIDEPRPNGDRLASSIASSRSATRQIGSAGRQARQAGADGEVAALVGAVKFSVATSCLTDLRTGAAGALGTDLLAVDAPATATIVGSGGQARYQLEALLEVRTPKEVLVWGRRREAAQQLVDEVAAGSSVNIDVADSLQAAVARADIVVTTTPSRAPLIDAAWVGPGTHITAVGSDLPGKVELDPKLLARATVVADRLSQCRTQGEISAALAAGTLELDDVHAELGEIAAGDKPGRSSLDEVTVADLTGVGVLDAAVAVLVTQRALERGVGERLRI